MRRKQHMVKRFMEEVKGLEFDDRIKFGSSDDLCIALIDEESRETLAAIKTRNMIEVADGLADLVYVCLYAANCFGFDLSVVFDEVHRSNMTKKGGKKAPNGKQLKPKNYEPPNIELVPLQPHVELTVATYKDDEVDSYIDSDGRLYQRNRRP